MLRWISTLAATAMSITLLSTCAPQETNAPSTGSLTELPTELSTGQGAPIVIPRGEFEGVIGTKTVSFLAHDLESRAYYVLEGSDVNIRHTPWSTFKIPNLLIALETGTAKDLSFAIEWDSVRRPPQDYWPKSWKQDLTLSRAFKVSAAWFFSDIALQIPNEIYRQTLARWGYGNAEAADGNDAFWLDRSLKISLAEQVAFLDKLMTGDLGVSEASMDALKDASLYVDTGRMAFYGKTGAGPVAANDFGGAFEGWYVGFVIKDGVPVMSFALHARDDSFDAIKQFRRSFAMTLVGKVVGDKITKP